MRLFQKAEGGLTPARWEAETGHASSPRGRFGVMFGSARAGRLTACQGAVVIRLACGGSVPRRTKRELRLQARGPLAVFAAAIRLQIAGGSRSPQLRVLRGGCAVGALIQSGSLRVKR